MSRYGVVSVCVISPRVIPIPTQAMGFFSVSLVRSKMKSSHLGCNNNSRKASDEPGKRATTRPEFVPRLNQDLHYGIVNFDTLFREPIDSLRYTYVVDVDSPLHVLINKSRERLESFGPIMKLAMHEIVGRVLRMRPT